MLFPQNIIPDFLTITLYSKRSIRKINDDIIYVQKRFPYSNYGSKFQLHFPNTFYDFTLHDRYFSRKINGNVISDQTNKIEYFEMSTI